MASKSIPFSPATYASRRKKLINQVKSGKILLYGNTYSPMNYKDNYYPFRQDSTFLYYIGIDLPDLYAIIDCDTGITTLYGDDVTMDMIIWTGDQPSLSDLGAKVGIKKIKPLATINGDLEGKVHYLPEYRGEHHLLLDKLLGRDRGEASIDLIRVVIAQRNVKSQEEIDQLEIAVGLTAQMHNHVMMYAKTGMMEHELVGLANSFAWDHNASFSFPPICTTQGQTLHNHYYGYQTKDGDIILLDSGIAIESGYCGDMTRTFPMSGRFTERQKSIYQIVADAHNKAVDISKPGVTYKSVHLEVSKVIAQGLIDMGWMKGNAEEAVAIGAHTLFFQHGLGHMMGMDVHDMENLGETHVGYADPDNRSKEFGLRSLRLGRELEKGFVITIEPGIYVIPQLVEKFESEQLFGDFINYKEIKKNLDAGGYRIENDYVVEKDGVRVLGQPSDFSVDTIEALRSS